MTQSTTYTGIYKRTNHIVHAVKSAVVIVSCKVSFFIRPAHAFIDVCMSLKETAVRIHRKCWSQTYAMIQYEYRSTYIQRNTDERKSGQVQQPHLSRVICSPLMLKCVKQSISPYLCSLDLNVYRGYTGKISFKNRVANPPQWYD